MKVKTFKDGNRFIIAIDNASQEEISAFLDKTGISTEDRQPAFIIREEEPEENIIDGTYLFIIPDGEFAGQLLQDIMNPNSMSLSTLTQLEQSFKEWDEKGQTEFATYSFRFFKEKLKNTDPDALVKKLTESQISTYLYHFGFFIKMEDGNFPHDLRYLINYIKTHDTI